MGETSFDIGLISTDPAVLQRVQEIGTEFGYSLKQWKDIQEVLAGEPVACRLVLYCDPKTKDLAPAEFAQTARFFFRDAFILCTVRSTMPRDSAAFAKKSGANAILLEEEVFETSKLEFLTTQILRASHLPIKPTDLAPGKPLGFDLYHVLPQRRKFLKFAFKGDELTPEKAAKLKQTGELYIHRSDADAYSDYLARNTSSSAEGLAGRCRGRYLSLHSTFADLVFLLSDQSEHGSYDVGAQLLKRCRDVSRELLGALAEFEKPWGIVNMSAIGELGSIERQPAVCAYAGLFALRCELPNTDEIMISALLSDLGLLLLKPGLSRKLRQEKLSEITTEEQSDYRDFPKRSMNLVLGRKLPIDDSIRSLMTCAHERADGKGLTGLFSGKKVPEGSQVLQLADLLDKKTVLRLGRPRLDPDSVIREIVLEERTMPSRFTPEFVVKLRKAFSL